MMETRYNIFFKEHPHPAGWKQEADDLLYHFFNTYETPGAFTSDIVPHLKALLEGGAHEELPDDWGYFWGHVLPRKDYVYFIDAADVNKIPAKDEYSWEGSALRNEVLVEQNIAKYLKIPTAELLKYCMEWDDFLTKNKQQP